MVLANLFDVNPVKLKKIGKLNPIDDTQAVKFVDARGDFPVLNLGDPGIGDKKFLVPRGLSNPAAVILHLPDRYAETIAQLFKLFSSAQFRLIRGEKAFILPGKIHPRLGKCAIFVPEQLPLPQTLFYGRRLWNVCPKRF